MLPEFTERDRDSLSMYSAGLLLFLRFPRSFGRYRKLFTGITMKPRHKIWYAGSGILVPWFYCFMRTAEMVLVMMGEKKVKMRKTPAKMKSDYAVFWFFGRRADLKKIWQQRCLTVKDSLRETCCPRL